MLTDPWVNVRIYAVQSIGKLGDREAVPALINLLENDSENDLVRAGAAAALGMLKDSRALLPLRNLIMKAEDLDEIADTALKAYKMIIAANWKDNAAAGSSGTAQAASVKKPA
jgi:HEAT repeat protein